MLGAAQKSPEAFRTISEVAAELDVPQHVLRFWETRFATVKPLKRGGGRRYYRPDDLDLLRGIRSLLYSDGFTIKGVQKILRERGPRYVMELGRGALGPIGSPRHAAMEAANGPDQGAAARSNIHPFPREVRSASLNERDRARFAGLLDELLELRARLRKLRGEMPGSS
jgi:DNA-binding transcriptional MerR regulator